MVEVKKKPCSIDVVFENCEVYSGIAERDIVVSVRNPQPAEVIECQGEKTYRMNTDEIVLRIRPHMYDLLSRIKDYHDITWVYVHFTDGVEIAFYAPWCDVGSDENTYEAHHVEADGTMIVRIADQKKAGNSYTCPYCGKTYDKLDDFAACVAKCRQNEQRSKKSSHLSQRDQDFLAMLHAYNESRRLIHAYEAKYHVQIVSGML